MFLLLDIPGIDPKTAYKLAKELKIQNIEELREAAEKGKLQKLEGFGEKTEQEILRGIEELDRRTERMLLPRAMEMVNQIIPKLKKVKGVVKKVGPAYSHPAKFLSPCQPLPQPEEIVVGVDLTVFIQIGFPVFLNP